MLIKYTSIFIYLSVIFSSCTSNDRTIKGSIELEDTGSYHVILLAGQSNMVGLGDINIFKTDTLPGNVYYINHAYDTSLRTMKNNFGPEVGLASTLNTTYPKEQFIFIKYAVGGSSLYDWSPNYDKTKAIITEHSHFNSLYDKFLKEVNHVKKNYQTKTVSLFWMQGETDARYKDPSNEYYSNFKNLIANIRKDLDNDSLPVIFGKIYPKKHNVSYIDNVRKAQEFIARDIFNTYIINTDRLSMKSDNIHYDSKSLIELGTLFGKQLIRINSIEK